MDNSNEQPTAEQQLEELRRENEQLKDKLAHAGAVRERGTLPPAKVDTLPANQEERAAFVSQHVAQWLKEHRFAAIAPGLQKKYLAAYNEQLNAFFAAQEAFNAPQSNAEAFRGAVSNRRANAELRMRNALRDMSMLEVKMRLGNWGLSSRQLAQYSGLQYLDLLPEWK